MKRKSYRDYLTQYIDSLSPDDLILTDRAVSYASRELKTPPEAARKAVNVTLARLEKEGYIIRLTKGVYCKKTKTAFGGRLLRTENDIIGYETGLSALNRLGLVSQMPGRITIATNLYNRKIPLDIEIEVTRPPVTVTSANYRYLQLLDAICEMEHAPVDALHPADVLKHIVQSLNLSTDTLILMARKYYPPKILMRTIDIQDTRRHSGKRLLCHSPAQRTFGKTRAAPRIFQRRNCSLQGSEKHPPLLRRY